MNIPFNQPYISGNELLYIKEAHENAVLSGDGPFTIRCHDWLESWVCSNKVLLTHSCTAALEMSALLLDIKLGDEIIMPSYTFVSTANAFVLRGAIPVFVDIREDTLNINEALIESAITNRTRAIVPVHYAGVGCEMDAIISIASKHDLRVVEDAAQGFMGTYKGRALGSIGDLGAYSFHETKNVISGEGGALLVNSSEFSLKAEVIREKGTNRSSFSRGEVEKYTWQSVGSSFLPGEVTAAFLFAQLEKAEWITKERLKSWNYYHTLLKSFEDQGFILRPIVPVECQHNAHMYYVILSSQFSRKKILEEFKRHEIGAIFHYIPLHTSPAGKLYGRPFGELDVTKMKSEQIIRLPLWVGISESQQELIVSTLRNAIFCSLS